VNNLPNGCTQDMVDAQCSPIAKDVEFCADCLDPHKASEMYPWKRNIWDGRGRVDVYLCESCVPRCAWHLNGIGIVNPKPCGRIQSPTAQGPWCAEHDRESEALDNQESEG
jgi:hypothetical protein